MKQPDEPPRVVDLSRYRKAVEKRPPVPAPRRPAGTERMIGSRKGAGFILALIILALIALWLAPALTNLI